MEFKGKIIAILQPRSGISKSGNPWMVQEYVIENSDQFPRKMAFEIFGEERIKQFNVQMGEELTVSFDIDARQWQERWFNSIRAWKIERTQPAEPAASPYQQVNEPAIPPFPPADGADDLPF